MKLHGGPGWLQKIPLTWKAERDKMCLWAQPQLITGVFDIAVTVTHL